MLPAPVLVEQEPEVQQQQEPEPALIKLIPTEHETPKPSETSIEERQTIMIDTTDKKVRN